MRTFRLAREHNMVHARNIWTEFAPGSGQSRRNPGLDAREKLSPVETEAEKAASNLHWMMMSCGKEEVKWAR